MANGNRNKLELHEKRLLRQIGLRINKDLHDQDRSVESLSFDIGAARSTLREIISGRSSPKILTLQAIVIGLGYKNLSQFFIKIDINDQ